MARALGGLEITGKPASVSQPGTAQGKLRRWTGAGAGVQGGIQHQVNRLFRTQEEGAADDPHVVDLADVTKGLGLDETDREKIERILTETRVDFAMSPKLRTPRFAHGLKGLSEFLMKTKRISPEVRMQVRKRATVWWRKYGKTTYEGKPMIRHVVTKSQLEQPTLIKSGPYIGPRGGLYADPEHKTPWKESHARQHVERARESEKRNRRKGEEEAYERAIQNHNETHVRAMAEEVESVPALQRQRAAVEKMMRRRVKEGSYDFHTARKQGWQDLANAAAQAWAKRGAKISMASRAAYAHELALGFHAKHAKGVKKSLSKATPSNPEFQKQSEALNRATGRPTRKTKPFKVTAGKEGNAPVRASGGPYYGPRGGKYADPQHTKPWKSEKYKMTVEGKDAEKTGQAMEAGIQKAADICKVKPPICHGNLGIPRSEMPQLPDSVISKFLKQYQDKGIKVTKQTKRVGELKATQREINADKAQGMLNAYKEGSYDPSKKPIIVSKDGYVLDGHHRWASMLLGDPGNTMRTYQVDVDIKTLLKDANGFEGVSQADFSAPSDMREASNAGDDEDHADVAEGQGKDKPSYEKDVKKALRMEALAAATRDSYLRSRHG